jgi:hypothetical protein
VSPATRSSAKLEKHTKRPSEEIDAASLPPSPSPPDESTLTRTVLPAATSRTKTSLHPLVSPATRFVASLSNAIWRPSRDTAPPQPSKKLNLLPWWPLESRLIRVVGNWARAVVPATTKASANATTRAKRRRVLDTDSPSSRATRDTMGRAPCSESLDGERPDGPEARSRSIQ